MPFDARVFQVLIASPGDVHQEREILAEVVYEWNHVNSRDRGVVLLPLRWETHATPEMGSRAQAVINRQVVDQCDMVVGVFWTRLGTPTGKAESGTAEEIARVGGAGKPVMLYFSRSKVDPESIDIEEYGRLREFRGNTYPRGLVESYSSTSEFRDKFARQLAIKMLEVVAEDAVDNERRSATKKLVSLALAEEEAAVLPNPATVTLARVECSNLTEIPDYIEDEDKADPDNAGLRIGISKRVNPNYYREIVDYFRRSPAYGPLRLAVTGLADQGVRDLYVEARISGLVGELGVFPDFNLSAPKRYQESYGMITGNISISQPFLRPSSKFNVSRSRPDEWRMELELPVVQAQRTVVTEHAFWINAESDCDVLFDATIYSSDSTPFPAQVKLAVRVERRDMTWQEIVKRFEEWSAGGIGG
ncbi:hypothetical protein ACFO0M_30345 [Micromonospora mangrovi]|uniref:DUF4062 domain-containing protein n=2 Tax=Micromonospora TaxID=1873 RepID=A0AAU8HH97_9ACTN